MTDVQGDPSSPATPSRPLAATSWQPIVPRVPAALPTVETEYHQFWRTERYAWWKPLLAVVLALLVWGLALLIGVVSWLGLEIAITGSAPTADGTTPLLFAINNVILALLIPICLFAGWLFTGQPPKWLVSVAGGFRWRWAARCLVFIVPLWLVYTGLQFWMSGILPTLAPNESTVFLIVVILLTTPFQAAGEEFLLRGLVTRAVGAWIPNARAALVVATLVSAGAFMGLHGAGDPWLNAFYFLFGVCASILVWRTGGLEAAVVIHVVNNMLAESILPFTDVTEMFNRQSGVGSPLLLVDMAVVVAGSALLYWQAGRFGLARSSAPGAVGSATEGRPTVPPSVDAR